MPFQRSSSLKSTNYTLVPIKLFIYVIVKDPFKSIKIYYFPPTWKDLIASPEAILPGLFHVFT